MSIGRDVTIPAAGDLPASEAYAALPDRPSRGVVIIHELYGGHQPEIHRVAERFAARGYAAVAPVLFESMLNPSCIRKAMITMQTGEGPFVEQLRRARAWLCEQTGLREGQVGLIGFCMGGGFALAAGRGWGAVSTNYGDIPKQEILQGIGPVIGCYGGRDVIFSKAGQKLEAKLKPLGVEVETHTFPTAGHSFLTDGEHPIAKAFTWPIMHLRYDASVAEEGWTRIMAFFDRHLAEQP
jgi:carboxymethylenebutenolidase